MSSGPRTASGLLERRERQRSRSRPSDGGGGAIVALKQDDGVFLQHLDPGGNASWGPTGVSDHHAERTVWSMISDGAGGTFVAWAQYARTTRHHAQRVDAVR
jgi:hypothetical protein